jgi:hypothetical protein
LTVSVAQKRSLGSAAFQNRHDSPGVPRALSSRMQVPAGTRPCQYQPAGRMVSSRSKADGMSRAIGAAAATRASNAESA